MRKERDSLEKEIVHSTVPGAKSKGGQDQGRPSPLEAMMYLPPVSDFPPLSRNFQTLENLENFTFSRQISRFSSAKISYDLFCFSHRPKISNFPLFPLFQYISPLFPENYYFPLL